VCLLKGFNNDKKNTVLLVHPKMLKRTVQQNKIDNGFNVYNVRKRLFGNVNITNAIENSTGLSFGLPKATQYVS